MKIRPLFHLVTASSLLLAALPLQTIQAAAPPFAAQENLLAFTSGGHALGFAADGMYAATGSHALHVEFIGANGIKPNADSTAAADGRTTPLGRVTYAGLWDGIDLVYSSGSGGIYTTTYTLAPGADPSTIRLRYNAPLVLNEDGTLGIAFETGTLTETAPLAWQEINGGRVSVEAAFYVDGQEAGFVLGAYDEGYALTIDPNLVWNTFLGGSENDYGNSIAVDGSGNVYVTGYGQSAWGSPVRAYTGGYDVFAAKLDTDGVLVWNTFLGGAGSDFGNGIAVDGLGNVYVGGFSNVTWGSPERAYTGSSDAFAAKLASNGALTWNTFLGGGATEYGYAVAVDASRNVYIAGSGNAGWESPVRAYTAGTDSFIVKLNEDGGLTWNTFLGGDGEDGAYGLAVDGSGNVYAAGGSDATWGTPVQAYTDLSDAFAVILNSAGALTWSTFLGGSGDDSGNGIAVDGSGNVYVTGNSNDTWGSPVRAYTYGTDGFAAKLTSAGALTWNTFLGGDGDDGSYDIAVDGSGNVYVSARSQLSWGSPVRSFSGGYDGVAVKLDTNGGLTWHTFLGGSAYDGGGGIAVGGDGNVYVTSISGSTWGGPVRYYTGGMDAFAVELASTGALTWNTFLGGCGTDQGFGIAADGSGNIYVTGQSSAAWGAPVRSHSGGNDAYVAQLNSSGTVQWNSFLGGSGNDSGNAIAIDGSGNVYVTGTTSGASWGSPVHAFTGDTDAFAAKLNAATGALTWNTFLGWAYTDYSYSIAVDGGGNAYLSGSSTGTWGSPVRAFSLLVDGFLAKLDSAGNLSWNTFLGGYGNDLSYGAAVDGSGNVYAAGFSDDPWATPVRAYSDGYDAFAAKLDASTGALTWNTFLGGSGDDYGNGIAADGDGNSYVAGYSDAVWGDPMRGFSSGWDAFAAKLDGDGGLTWSTFLGGVATDYAVGIVYSVTGSVYLSGYSNNPWGSPLRAWSGNDDGFAVRLNPAGDMIWNTFLGGSGGDTGNGIAADPYGNIYMTGYSSASWGSPVRAYTGNGDAYVATMYITPPGSFDKSGPANGSYTTTSPTLAWGASVSATSYEYCYDTINNNSCDGLWVSAGSSTSVGVSGLGNNLTYYWQARAVNLDGTVEADGGGWWSLTARHQTFADVPVDHSLWQYIEAFYTAGITGGCGFDPLIFCPSNNVTRAAMAVFLLRAKYGAGYAPPPATHTFSDLPVAGKEWQEAWVDQFYLEGITSGCGTSPLRYCPENPVTRAAMAVFILRALEGPSYTPPAASHFFADLPVAGKEWMEPWVDEVYRRGITTGCGTGPLIYCPETSVKRQAMAAFIVRAFNLPLP